MTIGELRIIIDECDSPTLEPLKLLFCFMDFINDVYKKEHDGNESPYINNDTKLEDLDKFI